MRKKLDTIVIAMILLSIVGIAEAIFIGSLIVSSNQEIQNIQANIQAENRRREAFRDLIQRQDEIEQEGLVQDLEELLPNAANFLEVVKEIELLGRLSGNEIIIGLGSAKLTSEGFELPNELRAQTESSRVLPENATYDVLEVTVTIRGDYEGLMQFLDLFKQSKYYMNITTMNINRFSGKKVVTIDTNMTVEIFVQKVIFN